LAVIVEGPMPQGQFLECMGIAVRVENLQALTKSKKTQQQIWDSYARLADPEQMGAIYKVLFISDKNAGEVYPFLSEETMRKKADYYE
jgi:SAM-dependent MidA family methyltransferase